MLMIKLVDARKGLHEKCVELFHDEKVAESIYMYLCDGIEECDEVELERKKGEWKHLGGDEWCCNQCGNVICTEGHWEHPLSNDRKMYHCNICGADMRGEEQ